MQITRNHVPTRTGPSDWFTGTVFVDTVAEAAASSTLSASSVHFTPGARTAWHTHPLGQTIWVTEGVGLCQRRGGPIEVIRPGDRVFFEPGEHHWHGAAPTRFMTHLAMLQADTAGQVVTWGTTLPTRNTARRRRSTINSCTLLGRALSVLPAQWAPRRRDERSPRDLRYGSPQAYGSAACRRRTGAVAVARAVGEEEETEQRVDAVTLLKSQIAFAHQWFDATVGDLETGDLHWSDPDGIMPVSAQVAHTLMAEDFILNGIVRQQQPLMMTSWAGKVGVSEPPPMGDWGDWARTVRVDLAQLRAYGAAVHAQTDEYLASLSDSDLDREMDSAPLSMGIVPQATLLSVLVAHPFMHSGEVSAIKGMLGKRGYPA